jgi:hypothetical protein
MGTAPFSPDYGYGRLNLESLIQYALTGEKSRLVA